jgi:hypothetical protein
MRVINTHALMEGIEKYVLSGAVAGIRSVKWVSPDDTPYTDGSTIHLPRPNAVMNDRELLLWRYNAEHELGHEDAVNCNPHWKEVMVAKKKDPAYKDDGLLWFISNLISDHVQEHNRVGLMAGRDQVLLEGRAAFLGTQFAKMGMSKDPSAIVSEALFHWDTAQRMSWNPSIPPLPRPSADAKPFIERLNASPVDIRVLKDESEVFDAAVEIRKLFDKDEMPPGKMKEITVEVEAKFVTDMSKGFTPGAPHTEKHTYIPTKGSGKTYAARKGYALGGGAGAGASGPTAQAIKKLCLRTSLPAKVRAFLMGMRRAKHSTGYRSGRLDTNRLTDVLRNRDDLFRRTEPVRIVNSAVSLLVDASGSMSGTKYQTACASALMLAEALQGVGAKVEIALFTENGGGDTHLIHEIILPFGRRFAHEPVLAGMEKMSRNLRDNADGENILLAYHRLKAQQETRKILVVISDGSPCACGPHGLTHSIHGFTEDVIKMVERDPSVRLFCMGIEGFGAEMYRNRVVVGHGDQLEGKLLELVKNALTEG